MERMDWEEAKGFMMTDARTAKIATIREDGSPHVVPVIFVVDADDLVFTTWHTTVKAKNIRRDPRVSMCVDELDSYVQVNGTAEIDERPDHFLDWTTRIVSRYVGQERAEEFGRRNAVAGEWLVRVRPSSFVALKNIAQ